MAKIFYKVKMHFQLFFLHLGAIRSEISAGNVVHVQYNVRRRPAADMPVYAAEQHAIQEDI